jgi:putative SOS response-associated peptidase YedK
MCGRFEIHSALEIIARIFGVDSIPIEYRPNYNIAPSQDILMIRQDGKRLLGRCRWGFIPSWSREIPKGFQMINAKAETVAEKPSFRKAFENQRCLIPADGFFEWEKTGTGERPYYIRLRSKAPFGFAGIYGIWTPPNGKPICTSAIITTEANEAIRPIHDRMPVIVSPDKYELWLDPSVRERRLLAEILGPFPSADMELYPVTRNMNSYRHNKPENIHPVGPQLIREQDEDGA